MCDKPYLGKNAKTACSQIVLKERLPFDLSLSAPKSKGAWYAYHYISAYKDSDLNNQFAFTYRNDDAKWQASQNTLVLSFN